MTDEKNILLFGSGFVAAPAVAHILRRPENRITIACRRIEHAQAIASRHSRATAVSIDVTHEKDLDDAVSKHDLVISLIPYTFHALVIKSAIKFKKNVLTTSYVSDAIRAFDEEAKKAGIIIMNEIGLDPGIDHLYAIKTISEVHAAGGKILGFLSYCGGLPAPECSNNPLGYKFSWSSRGVLLALCARARFYRDGEVVEISEADLMTSAKPYRTFPGYAFVCYPNRDSTSYRERYKIFEARDIVRGTLRYQGFPEFVKVLVDIGFLNESQRDDLQASAPEIKWNALLAKVLGTSSTSEADLRAVIANKANISGDEAKRILDGMKWIGLFSDVSVFRRGTLLDTLCATLEEKMQYSEGERDMVFLEHTFHIEWKDGRRETQTSTLIEYGKPKGPTSMATLVGTPCGIAAQMILDGVLKTPGVHAPYTPEINNPILEALEKEGISMVEKRF